LFFEDFDCHDFINSIFKIELEFEKQSTMMLLNFNFSGQITVPCDRCLDEVNINIKGAENLIIKFGGEQYNETDDIIIVPENESEINVAKYIYEFIQLNIPQKKIHKKGSCNPNIIKALERVTCKKETDPRWSVLNDLKIEN